MRTKAPKSFTISRAKWGRYYLLRSETEAMCCLGFYAKACGFPVTALRGRGLVPHDYHGDVVLNEAYDVIPDEVRNELAQINDSRGFVAPVNLAEAHIAGIFDLYDIKVRFVP